MNESHTAPDDIADYARGIKICTRLHNTPAVQVIDLLKRAEKVGNCPVCGGLELQADE